MTGFTKKIFIIVALISVMDVAMADRGIGKRARSKTVLNITTGASLRNSIAYNINSGLSYKGSLLSNRQVSANGMMNSTLVTYQKGNITYIIPYKHKIAMPDTRQGYTGVKLVIRPIK